MPLPRTKEKNHDTDDKRPTPNQKRPPGRDMQNARLSKCVSRLPRRRTEDGGHGRTPHGARRIGLDRRRPTSPEERTPTRGALAVLRSKKRPRLRLRPPCDLASKALPTPAAHSADNPHDRCPRPLDSEVGECGALQEQAF